MNRIRKTFLWLWQTKERTIFLITVLVLAFQIYSVFQTTEETTADPIPPMPSDDTSRLTPAPPESVPEIPPPLPPVPGVRNLAQNDPFEYREGGGSSSGEGEQESAGLKLLNIRTFGDRYVVQIETESSTRWYNVGDAFETYELVSVDADAETIEVFDESQNRRIEVFLED